MIVTTTKRVVKYVFDGLEWPLLVLTQDSCTTFKCRNGSGRITTFKELDTNKEFFLKSLSTLFSDSWWNFMLENTIVVDDSSSKHIINKSKNVFFMDTWTNKGEWSKWYISRGRLTIQVEKPLWCPRTRSQVVQGEQFKKNGIENALQQTQSTRVQ